MKSFKLSMGLLMALTALVMQSHAADNSDLAVTGKVVPPSCTPEFNNGGVVDYGNVAMNILNPAQVTVLDVKSVDLNIICNGLTRLAIKTVNQRVGSLPDVTEGAGTFGTVAISNMIPGESSNAAGLGKSGINGDKNTGGYVVYANTSEVMVDGKPATYYYHKIGNSSWTALAATSYPSRTLGHVLSVNTTYGNAYSSTPLPFTTLSIPVKVRAFVNKTSALDFSKEVSFDGQTTFEMIYP